jgi:hypothetical protein
MKKILTGFLGLFVVLGIVAGAGYALFSTTAEIEGMVLGTATPGLEIAPYATKFGAPYSTPPYSTTLDLSGYAFQKLLPGEYDWGAFWLKNSSDSGHIYNDWDLPLTLELQGQIIGSPTGNWGLLKDIIQMKVCELDTSQDHFCDTSSQTPFRTLATWQGSKWDLPGDYLYDEDHIGEGEGLGENEKDYVVVFYIPASYDETIAGKVIENMSMQVTGTQVP